MFDIWHGDCREVLKQLPDCSVDAIVTDPPYELGFMGKSWDSTGVAYQVEVWQECLRVLKAGGHLLAFGGSRTYHRLACAIEDAGFQIRDQIMWVYGSGFPKSLDVSKAIDKAAGAEREVIGFGKGVTVSSEDNQHGGINRGAVGIKQTAIDVPITTPATDKAKEWEGWGTALKPAHEPIVMARKPLDGTVANNVLTHGVGGINIDGCRVGNEMRFNSFAGNNETGFTVSDTRTDAGKGLFAGNIKGGSSVQGRFPANFIHDGSDEVLELFSSDKPDQSAARFFYCAKANKKDRNEGLEEFEVREVRGGGGRVASGYDESTQHLKESARKFGAVKSAKQNIHPTVKPTDLMRYLCRLVTPPNGTILDPFTGSGSTGKASTLEGFNFIGIEQSAEYVEIATARISHAEQQC